MEYIYADVLKELDVAQQIDAETQTAGYQERIAIAEIFKTLTYHYLSDIYGGPILYSETLGEDLTPAYDSGPEVYAGLLSTLETQIAALNASEAGVVSAGDVIYGGDITSWTKFANSLRMRIALRMIDANEAAAVEAIRKSLDPANTKLL